MSDAQELWEIEEYRERVRVLEAEVEQLRSEKLTPYMNELVKVYAENDALRAENERLRGDYNQAIDDALRVISSGLTLNPNTAEWIATNVAALKGEGDE